MAAEMVGESGSVVGVDHNPTVLQTARARAFRAGLANVTFVEGEASDPGLGGWKAASTPRWVASCSCTSATRPRRWPR